MKSPEDDIRKAPLGTRDRLLATLVIWAAFVITLIVLFEGQTPGSVSALTLIALAGILAWAAVLGTAAVWRCADPCEKEKRAQRVARLAATPDGDDGDEIDTLILARDRLPGHRSQHPSQPKE